MALSRYVAALSELARPYNSLLPLTLVFIGAQLGGANVWYTLVAILTVLGVHSAVTIANDIEDEAVDKTNNRNLKSITLLGKKRAWVIVWVMLVASVLLGIIWLPLGCTYLLLIIIAISWAYNSRPLQLSRRPIFSIVALGVCYGMVPFLIGFLAGGRLSWYAVGISIFLAIGRASLSMLKDYKDAVGDAKHKKKTFLLVFGRTRLRTLSITFAALGYGGVIAGFMAFRSEWVWLFALLAVAVAAWLIYERTKLSPEASYATLNERFHRCLHYELVFYGVLALWAVTL